MPTGVYIRSDEYRKKVSQMTKGRKWSHPMAQWQRDMISQLKTGNQNRLGKTFSEESKRKISEGNKGKTAWNKGERGLRKHSESTIQKMRERNMGSKSPTWKGGLTPLIHTLRNMGQYHRWKREVKKRDVVCVSCGSSERLEVNHKRLFKDIHRDFLKLYSQFSPYEDKETLARLATSYEPFWDVDNGELLCKPCHKQKTRAIFSDAKSAGDVAAISNLMAGA